MLASGDNVRISTQERDHRGTLISIGDDFVTIKELRGLPGVPACDVEVYIPRERVFSIEKWPKEPRDA